MESSLFPPFRNYGKMIDKKGCGGSRGMIYGAINEKGGRWYIQMSRVLARTLLYQKSCNIQNRMQMDMKVFGKLLFQYNTL